MSGTGNVIYIICDWLMRLAIANLLWITFSLLGVGVFGVFPASVATLALLREWLSNRRPSPLTFVWNTFRKTFISSNIVFWIGSSLLVILLLNSYISLHFQGVWFYLFISSSFFLMLGVIVIMLFSLLSLSDGGRAILSIKRAGKLLLLYPGRLVILLGGMILIGLCIRFIPGLIPLYSVNLVLLMVTYLFEVQLES